MKGLLLLFEVLRWASAQQLRTCKDVLACPDIQALLDRIEKLEETVNYKVPASCHELLVWGTYENGSYTIQPSTHVQEIDK